MAVKDWSTRKMLAVVVEVYRTVLQSSPLASIKTLLTYARVRKDSDFRARTDSSFLSPRSPPPPGVQTLACTQNSQVLATSLSCSGRGRPASTGRSCPKRCDISRCEFGLDASHPLTRDTNNRYFFCLTRRNMRLGGLVVKQAAGRARAPP